MGGYHSTPELVDELSGMPPGAVDRKTLTTLLSMTMYQSATLTFVLYDILLTLPAEVEMYCTRGFKSIVTPAFVISRYGAPFSIGTTITLLSHHGWSTGSCHAMTRAMVALLLILATATTVLFGVRTWAMCYRSRIVLGFIVLLTLGQLIGNITMATWMCPFTYRGLCLLDLEAEHQGKYWWFYVSSMGVSAILFVIALSSLFMDGSGQWMLTLRGSTCRRRLLQDGVIYFVCLVAVNVLNVAFILATSLMRWRAMNITLCTAITSLCSTRLVLHKLSPPTLWRLRRGVQANRLPVAATRAGHVVGTSTPRAGPGEAVHPDLSVLAFHHHVDAARMDASAGRTSPHEARCSSLPVAYTVETRVLRAPPDVSTMHSLAAPAEPAGPHLPNDVGRRAARSTRHPAL